MSGSGIFPSKRKNTLSRFVPSALRKKTFMERAQDRVGKSGSRTKTWVAVGAGAAAVGAAAASGGVTRLARKVGGALVKRKTKKTAAKPAEETKRAQRAAS